MKKNITKNIIILVIISLLTTVLFTACNNKNNDNDQTTNPSESIPLVESTNKVSPSVSLLESDTYDKLANNYGKDNITVKENNSYTEYSVKDSLYGFDGVLYVREYSDGHTFPIFTSYNSIKLSIDEENAFYQTDDNKKHNQTFINDFIVMYHNFCKENGIISVTATRESFDSTPDFSDEDIKTWINDLYTLENNVSQIKFSCFDENGNIHIIELSWYNFGTIAFSIYQN